MPETYRSIIPVIGVGLYPTFGLVFSLGATAPIGTFLGLDLDIRHITFAAGNFALGLYGKDFNVTTLCFLDFLYNSLLNRILQLPGKLWTIYGIGIPFEKSEYGEVRLIIAEIFRYFFRNPLRFFLPIRSRLDERAMDLMKSTNTTKTEGH